MLVIIKNHIRPTGRISWSSRMDYLRGTVQKLSPCTPDCWARDSGCIGHIPQPIPGLEYWAISEDFVEKIKTRIALPDYL